MNPPTFQQLPSVHEVLESEPLRTWRRERGHAACVEAARRAIAEAREMIGRGETPPDCSPAAVSCHALELLLERRKASLVPVINATGILLHTGLGRAPLASEAVEAISRTAGTYCNLELDLETGTRGSRTRALSALISSLTGAEAATVVNNNAAATILALKATAAGREVIVSRGQLVEIGGSFRLPEIFQASGARLREVGTTNKTRLSDYEQAIRPETAAILRVHTSNFRIEGFTESVAMSELSSLAHSRGLLAIDDIGSGSLAPGYPPNIAGEPTARESLDSGADLVLFSGDKLLGGPQCGVLLGKKPVIDHIRADPLMRALRVDKLTVAALEATLRLVRDGELALENIPLWRLLSIAPESLRGRAEALAGSLRRELVLNAEAIPSLSYAGGGSSPGASLPSWAVRISQPFPSPVDTEGQLSKALRTGRPAVLPRVHDESVILDLRAVEPHQDAEILVAVRSALGR